MNKSQAKEKTANWKMALKFPQASCTPLTPPIAYQNMSLILFNFIVSYSAILSRFLASLIIAEIRL